MTAINPATDIPSSVNTVEKLACWAVMALARCNPDAKILEIPGQPSVEVALATLLRASDGSTRYVVRASLPVQPGYGETAAKWWNNINEFSTTALPAAYKVN